MERRKTVATVGTFDGVHLGHRSVLSEVTGIAFESGRRGLAVTFDRHPLEVLAPERAPGVLSLPTEQQLLLEGAGVEVKRCRFDEGMASMRAADWLRKLRDEEGVDIFVVGYDNTFGCDGTGMEIADYRRIGEGLGIEVREAPLVEGISSSRIRKGVAAGEVEDAARMMGRPYRLSGPVAHGHAVGRTLGWPTANVVPDPRKVIPAAGVYVAEAGLPDGRRFGAVVNVGTRPTFTASGRLGIEAHLFGWEGSLYGLELDLDFLARLRSERRFSSPDQLRTQIAADSEAARRFLEERKRGSRAS